MDSIENGKVPTPASDYDDMKFLKSLLPSIKQCLLLEKMKLRIDILKIVCDYSQRNNKQGVALPIQSTTPVSNYT